MLYSIFRSLFWAQTIATKVKYGFFPLRDGVDSQNVSAFGPFGIWGFFFCVRDAQPAQPCFLQCVLGMPAIMFTDGVVHPPHDLSADDWECPSSQNSIHHFPLPLGKSAGRETLGVFRILWTLTYFMDFLVFTPLSSH